MNVQTQTPDLTALKTTQQAAWSSGDYPVVGTTLQIVGESLAESMDLRPGRRVLDVAAGNGNATLAAARRFCEVVSTDYVDAWLREGMARAEAERLPVAFRAADAEALPFEDRSFDAVTSTFGVMFAPDQHKAAAEMIRVCCKSGRIGLANWTAGGFIGAVFRTIGRHVPPPAGVPSPLLWGDPDHLADLFGEGAKPVRLEVKQFTFRYRSAEHWVDLWRTIYGPMHKAFAAVGPEGAKALKRDLMAVARDHSISGDETMIVPSDYLEAVLHRR